jgi:hypothetical protein
MRPQDILVLHRVQCVRTPTKNLRYDRHNRSLRQLESEWENQSQRIFDV